MSLLGKIGKLSPESAALEGTPAEVEQRVRAAHDVKLRPARAQAARRVRGWHEIQDDLVPRLNGRWFVSAATDAIFAPYRGAVWVADSIVPLSDTAELSFVVTDDLEVRFYERVRHPVNLVGVRPQAGRDEPAEDCGEADARVDEVTEADRRLRARDLERRLRALGIHCPSGALEPLTRSPAAASTTSDRAVVGGPVLTGRVVRRGVGQILGLR